MEDTFRIIKTNKGNYVVKGMHTKYVATLCVKERHYRIGRQIDYMPAAIWCGTNLPAEVYVKGSAEEAKKKAMELANIKKLAFFKFKPKRPLEEVRKKKRL